MQKLPIDLSNIHEVFIGRTEMPGYSCPEMEGIVINGYIETTDEHGSKRVVYLECVGGGSCDRKCLILQSMLEFKYSDRTRTTVHRGGGKGQIMDEILEDFQESPLKVIRIPIKTNMDDHTTFPANVKKAFIVFKELDMYETELEPAVIAKMKSGEKVEKYVLTVKKILGPSEISKKKEKIVKAFKAFENFFDIYED
jgi:hypothetical protein